MRWDMDDILDAFGVHGVGGTVRRYPTAIACPGSVVHGKSGLIDGIRTQVIVHLLLLDRRRHYDAIGH